MSILKKILGDPNKKILEEISLIVDKINSLEREFKGLSDDQLKSKTQEFKLALRKGKSLDDILPEAFATAREAGKRTLGQRAFDTQLISATVLHRGQISEQKTGEGKTLASVLAAYLDALSEKGVHVITVNDYLAMRDAVWMGQIYDFLGLSVGTIKHAEAFVYDPEFKKENEIDRERDETGSFKVEHEYLRPVERKEAYSADITYGTNNEFGFDYLRDNMVMAWEQKVQRSMNYAIIDEVDSILIDEARTPLIISAPAEQATEKYFEFAELVSKLKEDDDYNIDEKMRAATLTEKGIAKMEGWLGVGNIYQESGVATVHHIEQALKARVLFKNDKDYVVKDGEIIIVDEFTGRLMTGRRYSEGLHQAIEAKEKVEIKQESVTLATVTFQNLFRLYKKLSGMTGTAATEAEEFSKIYGLEVVLIPTNKPMVRNDRADSIYASEQGKFKALIREIKEKHEKGQPVLVGTISIEKNELLGGALAREGIECNLLNAKNHEGEAEIIAQAGKPGAVTVATNMAGRGVDIVLGGNPASSEDQKKVLEAGGLAVLGTERHESRRIDNQLRGRAGRQGDPGESHFFLSMDDDLMRVFGSDKMKSLMKTMKMPEDMPIENKIISRSIEKAQNKVEQRNFDIRKHLVEYDDVINKHREVIYKKRNEIIKTHENNPERLRELVFEYIEKEIEIVVAFHCADELADKWNLKEIGEVISTIYPFSEQEKEDLAKLSFCQSDKLGSADCRTELAGHLIDLAKKKYQEIEDDIEDKDMIRQVEKSLVLKAIDTLWVEHLDQMAYLREGIGLRGYGQLDPLVEYKKEAFQLFNQLISSIQSQVVYSIYKISFAKNLVPGIMQQGKQIEKAPAKTSEDKPNQFGGFHQAGQSMDQGQKQSSQKDSPMAGQHEMRETKQDIKPERPKDSDGNKIGRNDPCPCGSGKKYKKCHGQ